jgi:DNA-binding NarL/FixJ family response regulator
MLADSLKSVVEPHCDVVGIAIDGLALLEAVERLQPDIAVLDIGMPRLNGLEAGRKITKSHPKIKLIFMTMHQDPYLVREAFRAGASAFLLKEAAVSELKIAIDKVLHGDTYVTPSAAKGFDQIHQRDPRYYDQAPEPTTRQREVIGLLAEGLKTKEIAARLGITKRTVGEHKYAVMKRLGVQTHADLVRYAIENEIVDRRSKPKELS